MAGRGGSKAGLLLIGILAVVGAQCGLCLGFFGLLAPAPPPPTRESYPYPHHIPKTPGNVSLRFAMVHDVLHERFPRHGISCGQCLALVERLRAHLADVIHTHQRRRMYSTGTIQVCVRNGAGRRRPRRVRDARDGTQCTIKFADKAIKRIHEQQTSRKKTGAEGARFLPATVS